MTATGLPTIAYQSLSGMVLRGHPDGSWSVLDVVAATNPPDLRDVVEYAPRAAPDTDSAGTVLRRHQRIAPSGNCRCGGWSSTPGGEHWRHVLDMLVRAGALPAEVAR